METSLPCADNPSLVSQCKREATPGCTEWVARRRRVLRTDTTPGKTELPNRGVWQSGAIIRWRVVTRRTGSRCSRLPGSGAFGGAKKMYRIAFIDRDGGQRYLSKRRLFRQSSSRNSPTSSAYLFSHFHFWPVTERNADKAQEVPQVGTG